MYRNHLCLLLVVPALALPGCPEPENDNGGFRNIPDPGEEPCQPGGSSLRLLSEGLLSGAAWMTCPPRETSGNGPEFTGHTGVTTLVAGGSTELVLSYSGMPDGLSGTPILAQIDAEQSLAVVGLSSTAEDAAGEVTVEIYTRPTAPGGTFRLQLGFDDGTGTDGNPQPVGWYIIEFSIVETLGGDLQFALNWDSATDVDLHVVDPAGEMLFYGNPASTSGGVLDLDSNAGCDIDGTQNENAIWAADAALPGSYQVAVNYWSACEYAGVTNWRLTVLERGQPVGTYEGSFSPEDANPDADPLNVVTTFDFGG